MTLAGSIHTTSPFPPGFFHREDDNDDSTFYCHPRFVTHIDPPAIATVGQLYEDLHIHGDVLDLMSSCVSHFRAKPRRLVGLGMNAEELAANPQLDDSVVHNLNIAPTLPFPNASFDDAVCCVSVDYLTRPIAVFADVARVLTPNGRFVLTFSNRLFATKAIRGWLLANDVERCRIVAEYFLQSGAFQAPTTSLRTPIGALTDPLFAVWATTSSRP